MPKEAKHIIKGIKAKLTLSGQTIEKDVPSGATGVSFEMKLPKGKTDFLTWFYDENGSGGGAFFY